MHEDDHLTLIFFPVEALWEQHFGREVPKWTFYLQSVFHRVGACYFCGGGILRPCIHIALGPGGWRQEGQGEESENSCTHSER